MENHFTYLTPFFSDPNVQKLVIALLLGLGFCILGKILTSVPRSERIIPTQKPGVFGILDFITEKFIAFHDQVAGEDNRQHVPFCLAVFLFILGANLIGLIPGMPAATTTVWVNVAVALVVFCYFNFQGIKENGVLGYLGHFCGPVVGVAWLIFPVEIVSTLLRILTLNLRLYWNINADHLIVGIFAEMTKVFAFPFYFLGLFVAFMQAFVFVTLTMIYISLATHHSSDESGSHDDEHDKQHGGEVGHPAH